MRPPKDRDSPSRPRQCRPSLRWHRPRRSSQTFSPASRTHPRHSQSVVGSGSLSNQGWSYLCCRAVLGLLIVLDEAALCLQRVALNSAFYDFSGFKGRHRFGQTCPGIGTKYKIFMRISDTTKWYYCYILLSTDLLNLISLPHCFSLIKSLVYNLCWPWEWTLFELY